MANQQIKIVLGFDFGMKYIGYAVGQTITRTAQPLGIIKAKRGQPDWNNIKCIIYQWQPQALIVGVPFDLYDLKNNITTAAQKFAQHLQKQCQLPVYTIDEKLSSRAAWQDLTEQGKHPDKATVDATAAKIILQTWLNENKA